MARLRKVRAHARRSAALSHSRSLHCERLEDRRVLAALVVDTLEDTVNVLDGKTSLREAIFATNILPGADEISFDPELFVNGQRGLVLTQGELSITGALAIIGPGSQMVSIDARGSDPTPYEDRGDGSRIFRIADGNPSQAFAVSLSGLYLTGGDVADNGGAIYTEERLSLVDCRFLGCSALGNGGGVYAAGALGEEGLSVTRGYFTSNSAGQSGGAIYCLKSNLVLQALTISENTSVVSGGGAYVDGASVTILGSTVNHNIVTGDANTAGGGGLCILNAKQYSTSAAVTIVDTKVTLNSIGSASGAQGRGGGVFIGGLNGQTLPLVEIRSSKISANGATLEGGGLYSTGYRLNVIDAQFESNHAGTPTNLQAIGGGAFIQEGSVTFDHCTFAFNTSSGSAGGMFLASSRPASFIVRSTQVVGNIANRGNGGGIRFYQSSLGTLLIQGSTVTHNSANNTGGGLSCDLFANATIEDSVINFNSAGMGGGVFGRGGIEINRSVIMGNRAFGPGGGLNVGALRLTSSVVDSNAAGKGGGIWFDGGGSQFFVDRCTLSNNYALGGGGAAGNTNVQFVATTISGNTGGGLIGNRGRITLQYCVVTDNHGSSGGVSSDRITLDHSIVADNRDDANAAVDLIGTVSARFSVIGSSLRTTLVEAPVGSPGANGNLIGGPVHGVIDPLLGPLADNGGPALPGGAKLLTHALLPGSPAIGAGDPAAVAGQGGVPEFDGRGAPFTRLAGARIDVGAFEVQAAGGALGADFDFNGQTDGADFLTWQRNLGKSSGATTRQGDATADGDVDANDLAVWRARWGSGGSAPPVAEGLNHDGTTSTTGEVGVAWLAQAAVDAARPAYRPALRRVVEERTAIGFTPTSRVAADESTRIANGERAGWRPTARDAAFAEAGGSLGGSENGDGLIGLGEAWGSEGV